jgi:hydroxymethylbilane synthase
MSSGTSSLEKIRIAARHSDLARLQAYRVGDALRAAYPDLVVEYSFRASLGDQNLNDPLWKMPEKGVFTEDFVRDLQEGTADLVVHSWKDLPTEVRPGLTIACTLPRADQRDLLLMKSSAGTPWQLRVLTSSPRRAYNLDSFFREYLPFQVQDVVFENVRGNIPTRMRKLLSGEAHALIVAKAAVDRLLDSREEEFAEARAVVLECVRACRAMVLPLGLNPTAAAQGAIAVEIRTDRTDLSELLSAIHASETFASVVKEREILASYGGGCHQKIGVSVLDRSYGRITYLQGLTDSGETLNQSALTTYEPLPLCEGVAQIFPRLGEESPFFDREFLPRGLWSRAEQSPFLFVARDTAWPEGIRASGLVWTAGLKTWKKLAAKGVWVFGSSENLGEREVDSVSTLARTHAGVEPKWTKLTHEQAALSGASELDAVATYTLIPAASAPDLVGRTHFYWMSGTAFDRALALYPAILDGVHASGPGNTHEHLKRHLRKTPFVYLSVDQFRRAALS